MPRAVVVAILYVLLLCLQQEGYRHGIDHLRAELAQAHERALGAAAEPCDECALLSGAAHAVAGATPASVSLSQEGAAPPSGESRHEPSFVGYYAARAPPSQA